MRYTFKPEDKVFASWRPLHLKNIIQKGYLPTVTYEHIEKSLFNYRNLMKTEVFTSTVIKELFGDVL